MTLSEIKALYIVQYLSKDKYLIYSVGNGLKMPDKYLCTIIQERRGWFKVNGYTSSETNKLTTLVEYINDYVSLLEYDSEYYYPMYKESCFVNFIISDWLREMGFVYVNSYMGSIGYKLQDTNIYGDMETIIHITITDLSEMTDYFNVILFLSDGKFVTTKCARNIPDIKAAVNMLIKPYLLNNVVSNLKLSDKMIEINSEIDIIISKVNGLDVSQSNFKQQLKERLINLVQSL